MLKDVKARKWRSFIFWEWIFLLFNHYQKMNLCRLTIKKRYVLLHFPFASIHYNTCYLQLEQAQTLNWDSWNISQNFHFAFRHAQRQAGHAQCKWLWHLENDINYRLTTTPSMFAGLKAWFWLIYSYFCRMQNLLLTWKIRQRR